MKKVNMTENEMISVIIPVYRVEKYLDKCIKSVVGQTYKDLEIILVDDGSPDQCGAICDKWSEKDERIRVIHKAHGGVSDARNAGLDEATGAYIGFVDSDDYIHPEMYQKLYEKIKEYRADIAICGFYRIDELSGRIIRNENMPSEGMINKNDALMHLCSKVPFMVVWNKLYRKELFLDIRFAYGKISEDILIMFELFHKCEMIFSVLDSFYYYVFTPNSIMRGEKTASHLDAVEAYYKMLLFCQNNNYPDLLPVISASMVDTYMGSREIIKIALPNYRHRIREIKRMVLYGILKHGQSVRFVHKLYVVFPALYHWLLFIKRKLFLLHNKFKI